VSGITSDAGNKLLWVANAIIYVICEGKEDSKCYVNPANERIKCCLTF